MAQGKAENIDFFYVARQPIIDGRGKTYGYELLFRSGGEKTIAEIPDQDLATMMVATSGFSRSQDVTDLSKRIFINFPKELVIHGSPRALPPNVTVIEIQSDIESSEPLCSEVKKLKEEGYSIALDDFTTGPEFRELLEFTDIIKIDVLGKSDNEVKEILNGTADSRILTLAKKVDSKSSYSKMRELGFDLFQGFFFAYPENLTGRTIKSFQATKLKILAAIDDPSVDIEKLVELVASDPGITYRLLRLLNSAAFGFASKIESVRHSVMLLGNTRIRHWLRMVVLSDLVSTDKPQELLVLSLNRGKLLEELADAGQMPGYHPESLFLFGMLSLLDTLLDVSFYEIFKKLPLPPSFQEGYTDPKSPMAAFLHLLQALERAEIQQLLEACRTLEIKPQAFSEAAVRANLWTDSIVSELL